MLKENLKTDVLKVNLNFRHNSKESLLMRTNRVLEKNLETDVLKVMLNFRHYSQESLLMGSNKVLIEGVKDDMSKVSFRQNFDESPMRTNNKVAPEAEGIQGVVW